MARIRMLTDLNWHNFQAMKGAEVDVSDSQAKMMVDGGWAEIVGKSAGNPRKPRTASKPKGDKRKERKGRK